MTRTISRLGGAAALTLAGGLALAPSAFAATPGPGAATARGWEIAVQAQPLSVSPVGTPVNYHSVTNPQASDSVPSVGLTVSGRANISTGLQYGQATQLGDNPYATTASVRLDAPVTGVTGIPTYSASSATLQVQCVSDASGTPSGSVRISGSVPAGINQTPTPGTTMYFAKNRPAGTTQKLPNWEMKVVWNEQTTLANGQLQVVGMHAYYNVADRGLLGSGPVTGDVKLGIVTCGADHTAPVQDIPVADPSVLAATGVAGLAAFGILSTLRRRREETR